MTVTIDLKEILKDCPNGFELYSTLCGTVLFRGIHNRYSIDEYPVKCECDDGQFMCFTKEGCFFDNYNGAECVIFPSKDQRDWSKFTAPWCKKENKRFDPKTLKPFDKVLVKDDLKGEWGGAFFSHINKYIDDSKYCTLDDNYMFCIPYNDDTKHLIGTTEEAPEYYRYWED